MTMETNHTEIDLIERIDHNFKYHTPKDDQIKRYLELREMARQFAKMINEYCPKSREKSLAITKLEESVMWSNAAIARNE